MKSIIKIRILGLDYNTLKRVSINKTLECEDAIFVDQKVPALSINNGNYELPESIITAAQQADDWVSNQREVFERFIIDNELKYIINWEVLAIENTGLDKAKSWGLAPVPKRIKISEIEKFELIFTRLQEDDTTFTEDFKNNFFHVYQEMKNVLEGISTDKKLLIVLRAMNVGLMAGTNSYQQMLDLYKSFERPSIAQQGTHEDY